MSKSISFKGKILFVGANKTSRKNAHLKYASPSFQEGFEDNLALTMMASFDHLNLTSEEKKNLSRSHRKMLNYYRHISPFSLNIDANKLIIEINQSKQAHFVIKANHYGAYVCLAALYSGKLSPNKKIEFILENAPLALFPKTFMKCEPKGDFHRVVFQMSDDCWLSPFRSLYNNHSIKFSLSKTALKKAS
ncbi:MAG: hypothetical protein ACXVLQ_17965 [Bacteriovorax sp.]